MSKLHIDFSKRSCASTCLRKYYWQYIRNLRPASGSTALRYGSTWHGFLDGFYNHIKENGWSNQTAAFEAAFAEGKRVWDEESSTQTFLYPDYRTFENCTRAFIDYNAYYAGDAHSLEVKAVEKAFSLEFPNFIFDGKLDLQVTLNGTPWLMEHKTTSQYLSVQTQRMNRSAQTIGYWYACKMLNIPIEGVLISFHHLSARKKKDESYGEAKIEFQRLPQLYTPHNIEDWYEHFSDVVLTLERCTETNIWPKNYDNCYQFGQCSYLPLCDQYRDLGQENWQGNYIVKEWDVKKTVKEGDVYYAKL